MVALDNKTLLNSLNVDIELNPKFGANCLHFTFKGKFCGEASKLATEAWINEFENNPIGSYTFIWDCREMGDFDVGAKNEWMATLSRFSHRIEKISLVSDSILIRGAARLMSKFSSLNLHAYKSFEELHSSSTYA